MAENFDIIIIGGGLAGMTQSILLAKQGWNVACVDRETPETQTDQSYDIRTTAISWGSRNCLSYTGIWDALLPLAEPIRDILILDEDSPIELEFNSADVSADAFGWIVDNRDLRTKLFDTMTHTYGITHITGAMAVKFIEENDKVSVNLDNGQTIAARLIIGADGRGSTLRDYMNVTTDKHDYKQSAIVCLINHDKPHNGMALEHFHTQGPFAVLPFTNDDKGLNRSALVWTVPTSEADQWISCADEIFNAALQSRCGNLFGNVSVCGSRAAWPLNVVKARSYTKGRMLIMAEAAHGMHPIAGQGLNMSLRDIAALTEILDGQPDPGAEAVMRQYQKMRRVDNYAMVGATHILNGLFGTDLFPVRAARRFGLHAVARLPFAKKFFMRQAMGATGNLPKMIRDAA